MSALSTPAGGGILTAASSSGTTSASSTTSSSATSATPGTTLKGTASGKSKFQTLDINNLYCHGKSENSEPTSSKSHLSRKHGMQSLGKVPSARRPPANLPSLKTESGLDSNSTSTSQANTGQSATPAQQPQQQQVSGSGAASAPPASSAASAPPVGPSPSAVPAHSAPQAPHHSHQICQPQNASSHPHAGGYQGGWAGLPPHRTAQFQQEFPSLDGSTPTPSPPVAAQNSQQAAAGGGGAGPALRPHTEGGWLAGGGGRAEGPAPVADSRSTLARTVPLPSFMVKGSTGMGGGGFPAMLVPAPARGGPPRGPPHHAPHHSQQSGHHPSHHHCQTPPPQVHHRARDVPTIEKLMQRPIIKEEELNSMDQINKDAGWAIHDDIDYNQKLAFSDDDESTPSKDTSNSKSGKSSQQDKEKDSGRDAPAASSNSGGVSSSSSINNMNNNMSVSSSGNSGTAGGNSVMGGAREPAVLAKSKEDDEIWAMRQRQRNQEVSAAVERARQRQEEEERRYHQQQQLQDKDDKSWADSQQGTQSTLSQDWSKDPPEKSPSSGRDSDTPRPHSHGPPSLDRSASRDSVRNGPVDQVSSDFKQIGSESRNFRDNKDRDRPRDRDYQRDRDFYRDNRDRESDREWERDTAPPRDRDRDGARQDRESSGFNKYFNSHLPPRFAKQQGRGGGQQERMGFERVEFARSNSGNSFNDSNKHRNDPRNEEQSPLSIQFTTSTSRWSFQNMKNAPGGVQREPFKRGQDDKGMRRDREMKEGMDKGEDRRRERHTPDEPRGQRHPTRKLSGSSDGRHQSNRDYDDREDDYNRWDKDHDRRSGSNLDDKKHSEYNDREGSYDWRSSDKDYGSDKNRNYRDVDRQSSRESQKDFDRKVDYDRKSSDSYEPKNNAEKFSEVFDRKCSGQDFSDKKSIEKYDRERREDRQDINKQPERPDSRNSRNSRESAKDTFKQDSFSDKEFQGNSWADFPEPLDKESSNHNKNTNVSNNGAAPKAGFQEKPNFADKVESKNESYPSGNYRDRKDYKSDSDESKRSGYGQQHMKKVPSNLKKTDLPSKDKSRSEDSQSVGGKDDPNANVPTKTESSPKAWADSLVPSSIVSENNIKNQNVESKIENNNKETESTKTERKQQDSGKEKAERKLSSSGSEKKSQTGSRNRLDSGGSRKAYVFYNRDRSRWERGRSDGSRRRPGKGRNSRDAMYSESEVSGDEERTKNNLVSADGGNKGNRRNVGGQFSNERKRHDGREAFAPRGEPSRRGRGSFRGRGAVHSGYPPSSKSPFGLTTASASGVAENEESKSVDSLTSDEKMKLKQQALGAGISGKDRRGGGHGKGSQEKGKKISGAPASTEEEAWETTSEHSEAGSRVGKAGMGNKTLRSQENKDKKQVGQSQTRGGNPPANNRQNSSGSINKGSQPNKKEIPPFGSNTTTTVNRVDDIKYSDAAAVAVALGDMKISGPTKSNKSDQKLDKETEESPEILEDGFQEVKSKNKEKGLRVGGPPSIKDEPQNCNRQLNQKGQQTNKVTEQSHKNNQSRNSSEKSASGGATRSANTGPPAPISKVNGPQNVPSHERHNMGPPQNKPNQFDRPRQSNLPPRLVKQREHNRMQKHQGFNQSGSTEVGSASVPIVPSSAWDKPINQTLRENEQPISSSISNPEASDIGVPENHSEQSSQRSTPSNQTNDQKAPGNREKATTFDGTTTPVQTIIFENTNYKSAPSDALKQKFASGPVSQSPAQPNGSQPQSKAQQSTCAPAKPIVSITSQTSDLDHPILSFATENQQTNAFMTDFNQDSQQGSSKPEATPLQLPMSFIPKPSEDSSDMKLDFFDSDLSQLAEDKTGKGLGMRSMRSISSPSQNTMSTATDQELNMKIASVKKVWDTSTVVEHPVPDESGHGQHNLAAQHMSVSSPHSLTSQHNISSHHMSSQHTLTQQLGSPHGITQHNLVSQHGLGNQHNMTVSSPSVQFTSSFEDHQNNTDVSQSQGFSPGANGNISNQTTNVCKVKPTQQTIHSSQGLSQSTLQNMQASLISQQATTALQSMGNVGQSIQGVGGVMGLSPPPMPHTYNHINYPPSQYGGISAIPSPPTVVFNSSQQLLNSSQQLPSQGGLYNAFQIDQSRSQFGAFPGGPYGAGSTPYNYQPQDMFQGLQGQYRMQELFQAAGSAAFGQSGQLGTNPSTVLISSSTNSLMSATVKPSTQQIGAIGSKASSYGGQQYLGYGGPHEAGGAAPPPYAAALPPPSLVRAAPPPQAAPPPPPQLQPPNTYYSQSTGGQTGFFQQPGSVSANYGLQFGQPNQNHNNATLQGFGSQVMSNQFQIAAAMQQQYGRAQQQQASAATPYGVSTGQQQSAPGASAVAVAAQVKQDHHQPRPQQLKSPLQDHPNNGMFCNLSQQPPQSAPPTPYTSVPPPQPPHVQQHAQSGTHSPKGGTPNPNSKQNNSNVGVVSGNSAVGGGNSMVSGSVYQQQGIKQQHSPPHHKYPNYQHMQQVVQGNGRQASLSMAINRGGGGSIPQQRYPPPIQRPPPPLIHPPPPSYGYPNYRGGNNPSNSRHTGNNGGPKQSGGFYQQNNRSSHQTVTPSPSDQSKGVTPSGEDNCPSPTVTTPSESQAASVSSPAQPPATTPTNIEVPVDKKSE